MATLETTCVALDCEMVGVGILAQTDMLARVSLVDQSERCLYDRYVKPTQTITNYRTRLSGITPDLLIDATEFTVVQSDVAQLIKGRILVGHSLEHDFEVLHLFHPPSMTRDTAHYLPFMMMNNLRSPSLKMLAKRELGLSIQQGTHNSVTDARVAMKLYLKRRKEWEKKLGHE